MYHFIGPIVRDLEVSGLDNIEVAMYYLAWKHNRDGLGYVGLCDLWFRELGGNITLYNIQHVWNRLTDFQFFNTDVYQELYSAGGGNNEIF